MATYFVRKTGSDANSTAQAQVAATAWLTIDKAANNVAAADTVVVGAGVYRELVTMDTAGTSGNQITFVADVDGALGSGDPGLVIISAYANEASVATRQMCLDPNGIAFITWRGFVFTGGTVGVVWDNSSWDLEELIFEDCVLISGATASIVGMALNTSTTAPAGNGLRVRRCVFAGSGFTVQMTDNATAERDMDMQVESCLFALSASTQISTGAVEITHTGSDTFKSGGITVVNSSMYGYNVAVKVANAISTTYPVDVLNCVIVGCTQGLNKATSNDGALTSDFNTFASMTTTYLNVSAGTDDEANTTDPGLYGGLGDYPLYRFWGWSPYKPWEPIRLQDDAYIHAVIGDGDTATASAFDMFDEARPMYGTVDDRGAVEGRARPELETTTKRTGANAVRFEGAGFHDMLIPVGTSLTTVDVYAQHDATYAGTLPQLQALNIPGVADQTDVQTGASGSFEKLTVTFTATSDGIARIRLISNDTSAAGECFFDDLAVS